MATTKNLFLLFIFLLCTGLSINTYAGPYCGDGNVDTGTVPPEECDEGDVPPSSLCNNTTDQFDGPCQFTICGDGVVQTPNGEDFVEECEPPNTATCNDICMTITTTTTTTTTTAEPTTTTTTAEPTTTTTTTTTTTAPTTTTTTTIVPGTTVVVGDCDSGVSDPDGSITAGILDCNGTTRNHGQFVNCSARFVNKRLDLTQSEKDAIMSCVGSSDIGKQRP